MRVFVTKAFNRFARSERISVDRLQEAVGRAGRGLVDADLGGGLIKQRVARPRQGRSGGYRTVIAFRWLDRAVFLHGFAKSERDNRQYQGRRLGTHEEACGLFLHASLEDLETWCERGELEEVR